MAEFKNYKEVAFLLSKAVQGQLTEKEEETLGKWRQEFPENELLYRRVLTSEFIISKSKQWEQVDLVMAYLKVRQKCEHRLRRVRLFQVTAVAVSVLLLLVSGLFYFVLRDKSDRYPLGLMTENITWKCESGTDTCRWRADFVRWPRYGFGIGTTWC